MAVKVRAVDFEAILGRDHDRGEYYRTCLKLSAATLAPSIIQVQCCWRIARETIEGWKARIPRTSISADRYTAP